jgi:hypothetical protein
LAGIEPPLSLIDCPEAEGEGKERMYESWCSDQETDGISTVDE